MKEGIQEWFQGMEYVYEVCKEKSFSRAAKNLFVSQPSLSAAIKRIETKIGYPLFDRSASPIRLTECGERYIQALQEISAVQNSFYNYITDYGGLKTGNLKLGGSSLFSSYVLPELISHFISRYPEVKIELIEENTAQLRQFLLEGIVDIVIDNSKFEEGLFNKKIYREEYLLLAVPKSFSANKDLVNYQIIKEQIVSGAFLQKDIRPVPLSAFQASPFVLLKPGNDTRQRGLTLCRKYHFTPRVVLELDQQATAYNVTCSGMGISFISNTLINSGPYNPEVIFYKLEGDEARRNLCFYWKQGKYISRAMEEFLKL